MAEATWCVLCGARFTEAEIEGATGCPKCGSKGVPCDGKGDVVVECNWHELRILTMWAERWAQDHCAKEDRPGYNSPATVAAIAYRLQRQHPELPALTFSGEIAALPKAAAERGVTFGKIEVHRGGVGHEIVDVSPPLIETNGPGAVGFAALRTRAKEKTDE